MNLLDVYEQNAGLILASEDWAKIYRKDDKSFGQLITAEAQLSRRLIEYLKDFSTRAPEIVDWYAYNRKLAEVTAATDDFNVDVIVGEIQDGEDQIIMQVVYDPIAQAVAAGIAASEASYKVILPAESLQDTIAKVTRESVATLVGKRVDSNGNIIPAKNPSYHISEVTRQQIIDSVRTSLSLGEDQAAATARMQTRIKDPKRAERIASTEAVNGYQGGQYQHAKQTGAVGKEWQSLNGACPLCVSNTNAGIINIDAAFPTGHKAPTAHPFDRCGMRYVYQEEIDAGFVDLESIAQIDVAGRPSAEINNDIEELLKKGDADSIAKSIALAKELPKDDIVAMLSSISYNGKGILDGYYTMSYDVATKKIVKKLVPGKKDPLEMTADEIAKAAGIGI